MGKISDIVNAPEFAAKSPLEKAQARRDFFAVFLDENPNVGAQFEQSDDAGKQGIADAFKAKLETELPDAFKTDGSVWTQNETSKGLLHRQSVPVKIGDIETEQFLAPLYRDRAVRQAAFKAAGEMPDGEEKKKLQMLYALRFGDEAGAIPDELIHTGKAGRVIGGFLPDGRPDPKDWRNYPVLIPAALRTGGAIAGRVAGAAIGAETGPGAFVTSTAGAAVGSAIGDAAAQGVEIALGERDRYSKGEAALNTLIGALPSVPLPKGAGMLLRAGVRGAEGAAIGAGQEAATEAIRDGKVSGENIATAGGVGAALGALIGAFEPKIAALFAGKTAREAMEMKAPPSFTPKETESLLSAQKHIEESLGIGRPQNTNAAESALAISAEHPPAVKSASESAAVLQPELAANEVRAADFEKARVETRAQEGAAALGDVRAGQLGGPETIALGDDAAKNQLTAIEQRPGESASERARVKAQLDANTPKVDDGSLPPNVQLSPQAQAVYDQHGFIAPKLAASLAGGAAGFATGAAQDPEGETTQERTLNRLKTGMMMGVVGAGGVYMIGRRFSNPAPRSVAPTGSVLAEVDAHLAPMKGPSLAERAAALPNKLRGALITRFASLDKLSDDVAKANPGTILPELSLSRKFEQVAGAEGKAAQDVRDFEDSVVRQLAPKERQDFDRMLVLKRTGQRLQWNAWLAGEQARIAAMPAASRTAEEVERLAITQDKSVAKWTLPQVDAGLAELEKKLGTPRFNQIDQLAAGEFQQQMDKGLQLQVAAGRISPEGYAAIKANNDFYAPFRVLSAIEGHDGFSSGGGVDTRKQVVNAITGISDVDFRLESPTVAAAENLARGRVLAEKNLKMLELARLADADATGSLIRKLKDGQSARRGMETVNYFEQGVPLRLEVPPNVAEAIKGMNPAETGVIAGLLQRTGAVFRFGATTANAAFQARNFVAADQPRLWLVSKYGLQADPRELFQVPTDFAHALYSSILGNVAGKETALYRQFYESGAAGATFQDAIERIGGRSGDTALSRSRQGAAGLLDDASAITRVAEEATKLMGFKRGIRLEGIADLPPAAAARKIEEVVAEVRNFAGSPDFARHGTTAKDMNMLLTFFNARIQGVTSDLSRLGGGDGAKAARDAWVRLGGTAGLTAAYFWYRNHQGENAEDFARVPEWEKQSHVMIPRYDAKGAPLYSKDEHGESVREYWKIPKREGVKLVANLTEAALEFAQNKEPGAVAEFGVRLLEDASPINIGGKTATERMESAIGNLNPALRMLYEVPANRDTFRHRPIVPASKQGGTDPTQQQFPGRTPELYVNAANLAPQWLADPLRSPLMLQHLTQGLTGGLVKQFTPNQAPKGERDPTAAAMAANPVGRAFVGSMQVGDDGRAERAKKISMAARDQSITLRNDAARELDEISKLPNSEKAQRFKGIIANRPELAEAINNEAVARQKNFSEADHLARSLPVRDGSRARYLATEFNRLAPAKRAAFLKDQRAKGLLTNDVLQQFLEIVDGPAGKN